jgi:hypothetical protein
VRYRNVLPYRIILVAMTHDAIRRLLILPVACLALLASGALLSAVDFADQGGKPAGGGVAQLEFLVASNDGTPIVDLKPEEVTLRIGGRERKVTGLELKKVEAGAAAPGAAPASSLQPPYASNADAGSAAGAGAGSGRTFFLVFEDESIRPGDERPIRASVEKFLGSIGAADRVGMMTLPKTTVRVDPTTDRGRIKEAMQQFSGRRPNSSSESDRQCRARDTLEGMRSVLSNIRGQGLTTVVLFSAALESPAAASADLGSQACRITTEHFQGNVAASAQSRAHVFVVQAEESVSARNEGLETFASQLGGGVVLKLVGGASDPLERVSKETSSYYVLSFQPTSDDKPGASQRLEIRTSRGGAIARAQGEYAARAGAAAAGAAAGNVRDMLKTPTQFGDVPVRVVAFPSRAAGDKIRVLVLASPGPDTKFASAAIGIIDAKNQMRQVVLDDKQLAATQAITAFEVDPGSYRVRLVATDASGKGGSAEYPLDATLKAAGSIKLSGMVLGALRNNAFTPVMEFKDDEVAIAYVEAYGDRGQKAVGAKVEVVGADGKVIQELQPGGQATTEPDKVILLGQVPLKELKPGDYTIRLRFQLEGEPEGIVSHTLRKVQ